MTVPKTQTCIFCREVTTPPYSTEHVIPRTLFCPEELVLANGEVCGTCNNRLSRVDEKLTDALRAWAPFMGHRTKKGKWPRARLPNATVARTEEHALSIDINEFSDEGLRVEFVGPEDAPTELKVRFKVAIDERVARGLHKVSLEMLAYLLGPREALRSVYDAARDYAMGRGHPFRPILHLRREPGADKLQHGAVSVGNARLPGSQISSRFVLIWLFGSCFLVALEGQADMARSIGKMLNTTRERCVTFDQRGIICPP